MRCGFDPVGQAQRGGRSVSDIRHRRAAERVEGGGRLQGGDAARASRRLQAEGTGRRPDRMAPGTTGGAVGRRLTGGHAGVQGLRRTHHGLG